MAEDALQQLRSTGSEKPEYADDLARARRETDWSDVVDDHILKIERDSRLGAHRSRLRLNCRTRQRRRDRLDELCRLDAFHFL